MHRLHKNMTSPMKSDKLKNIFMARLQEKQDLPLNKIKIAAPDSGKKNPSHSSNTQSNTQPKSFKESVLVFHF